jgi:hypothetical protein
MWSPYYLCGRSLNLINVAIFQVACYIFLISTLNVHLLSTLTLKILPLTKIQTESKDTKIHEKEVRFNILNHKSRIGTNLELAVPVNESFVSPCLSKSNIESPHSPSPNRFVPFLKWQASHAYRAQSGTWIRHMRCKYPNTTPKRHRECFSWKAFEMGSMIGAKAWNKRIGLCRNPMRISPIGCDFDCKIFKGESTHDTEHFWLSTYFLPNRFLYGVFWKKETVMMIP